MYVEIYCHLIFYIYFYTLILIYGFKSSVIILRRILNVLRSLTRHKARANANDPVITLSKRDSMRAETRSLQLYRQSPALLSFLFSSFSSCCSSSGLIWFFFFASFFFLFSPYHSLVQLIMFYAREFYF